MELGLNIYYTYYERPKRKKVKALPNPVSQLQCKKVMNFENRDKAAHSMLPHPKDKT